MTIPAMPCWLRGSLTNCNPDFRCKFLLPARIWSLICRANDLYHDRSHYPYPGLVLLDLKMPKMDGFAVLEWLKGHPEHADVPIVVLSGFVDMVEQVTRAYGRARTLFCPSRCNCGTSKAFSRF